MHSMRSILLWLLALALFGGVIYAVTLTLRDPEPTGATDQWTTETPPRFVAYQTTIVGTRDGVRQWRLEAESVHDQDGQVHLVGITQGVLYRDGEAYLEFTAERGIWNRRTEDLHLLGNVKVYQAGEQILATDSLRWQSASELLIADSAVEVRHEGTRIEAQRMRGEMDKGRLIFEDGVKVETSGGLRFTLSSRLEYDLDAGDLVGLGPVRLEF